MTASPTIAAILVLAAMLACPAAGHAEPPTLKQRDAIQEYLAPNFLLPQTSIWRFADLKPYVSGEMLVCGTVNFQSAMHRYQGFKRFYATLDHDRVTLAQIENPFEDPSGRLTGKLDLICGK